MDAVEFLHQNSDLGQGQIQKLRRTREAPKQLYHPENGKILGGPTAVFGAKNVSPKSAKLKVFKKASMTKNSWEAHASAEDEMGVSQR
ncbi:hypothetical protein TNCV_61721 [Trichonephila clavipes]|nr:hypothetical protein TNCV_61721 [Trichonephila clavipes]